MKKYKIGIAAVLLVGLLAAGVFAFGGFRNDPAAQDALAAGDYNAFVDATGKNVTQPQFDKFAAHFKQHGEKRDGMQKAKDAIQNNDFAAWQQAMSGFPDQTRVTQANFDKLVRKFQDRQKSEQAIASNDFTSWKQAMSDLLQLQQDDLTQETFDSIKGRQAQGHARFGGQFHPTV